MKWLENRMHENLLPTTIAHLHTFLLIHAIYPLRLNSFAIMKVSTLLIAMVRKITGAWKNIKASDGGEVIIW